MFRDLYHSLYYSLADSRGERRRFGSTVKASPETISDILNERNLGETGHEEFLPSDTWAQHQSLAQSIKIHGCNADTLHFACFVGFLAIKSEVATIEEILGDVGLIHEMAHRMCFGEKEPTLMSREELAGMAHRIEQAIPGYPFTPSTSDP